MSSTSYISHLAQIIFGVQFGSSLTSRQLFKLFLIFDYFPSWWSYNVRSSFYAFRLSDLESALYSRSLAPVGERILRGLSILISEGSGFCCRFFLLSLIARSLWNSWTYWYLSKFQVKNKLLFCTNVHHLIVHIVRHLTFGTLGSCRGNTGHFWIKPCLCTNLIFDDLCYISCFSLACAAAIYLEVLLCFCFQINENVMWKPKFTTFR